MLNTQSGVSSQPEYRASAEVRRMSECTVSAVSCNFCIMKAAFEAAGSAAPLKQFQPSTVL